MSKDLVPIEEVEVRLGWFSQVSGNDPYGVSIRIESKMDRKVIGEIRLSRHQFADALASRKAEGTWQKYRG